MLDLSYHFTSLSGLCAVAPYAAEVLGGFVCFAMVYEPFRLAERMVLVRSLYEDCTYSLLSDEQFAASLYAFVSDDVLNVMSADRPDCFHDDVAEACATLIYRSSLSDPKGRLDRPQVVRMVSYQLLRYTRKPSGERRARVLSYEVEGVAVTPLWVKFSCVSLDELQERISTFDVAAPEDDDCSDSYTDGVDDVEVVSTSGRFTYTASVDLFMRLSERFGERKARSLFRIMIESADGACKFDLRRQSAVDEDIPSFINFMKGDLPSSAEDKAVLQRVLDEI